MTQVSGFNIKDISLLKTRKLKNIKLILKCLKWGSRIREGEKWVKNFEKK